MSQEINKNVRPIHKSNIAPRITLSFVNQSFGQESGAVQRLLAGFLPNRHVNDVVFFPHVGFLTIVQYVEKRLLARDFGTI